MLIGLTAPKGQLSVGPQLRWESLSEQWRPQTKLGGRSQIYGGGSQINGIPNKAPVWWDLNRDESRSQSNGGPKQSSLAGAIHNFPKEQSGPRLRQTSIYTH
ncbi:hypothetical protein SLA2020_055570 [Shorea laevis]